MDSQLLSCELCSHPFDDQNHIPRFIPECGHTLCTACILTLLPQMQQDNAFQCPLDKAQVQIPEKDISAFPPNLSLIKILDASMSPKKMCSMHPKEANLHCVEHNSYICEDCALFGVHQGHTIQKAVEFESEFDIKTKEVNEIIGKIGFIKQKFDQEADGMIENRRNVLLTLLQDEFDAILNTFLAKKESITRELTDYFYTLGQDLRQQSSTLKEIDGNLFNLVRWREQVSKKQDDKKFLEGSGSPIKILQDDINDIKPCVEEYLKKQESHFDLSVLQEKIQQARISINSSFFTTIDHFFSFQTQESDKQNENKIRERASFSENLSKMSISSPQLEKPFADFIESPNDPKAAEEEERFHYILKTLDLDVLWRQTEKGRVLNLRENTKKSSAKPFWQKMYNTLLRTKDMSASFQHIRTLDLVCKEFTDAGASNLGRALEKLVNLEKLQINFEENKSTSSEGISSLGHSLGCLVNLRELTLNFTRSPKIGSKSLSSVSQGLSKLVKLQRLRLIFEGCPLIDDQGLSYMSSSLIYLASLTKLELRFTGCNLITDTGVTKVSNLLGDLAQLQKIKLDFTGCIKITNTGVARLGQALTKNTNLETFVLSLREVKDVNDNGFAQIAQALSKSTVLKHLDLDFAKCYKISNYALLELTQTLIYLPLLQKLVLRFGLCEGIDDQGFSKLVPVIGALEHLYRLTLDFNNYQIRSDRLTEKSFMTLAGSILKLISLRHLELGFEGFTTMGDRSLAQLSSAISGLINLREVVLDFTGCKSITDSGVEKLSGIMPELMNLTLLWVTFKGCDQITAQAKEELRVSMGKLNNSNGQFSIEY